MEYKSFFKEVKGNEGSKCHYNTRLDAYEYWKNHFNPNKEDCCNLRINKI